MNTRIFFIEQKPADAAKCLCDNILRHPDARLLEMVRLPIRFIGPFAEWVQKSSSNWRWLRDYVWAQELERQWRGLDLISRDYGRAYGAWKKSESLNFFLPEYGNSEFPRRLMPEEYRWPEDVVEAWRLYYFNRFRPDAAWTRRTPPQWFVTF